jgi:hypothetical protein
MTSWWWQGVTKLLLCGLSGAGKTTAAEQLAAAGWAHFDCEKQNLTKWLKNPLPSMPRRKNVVASWGFVPEFASTVKVLERAGYLPIWLWGEKHHLDASLHERGERQSFIDAPIRETQKAGLLYIQAHMVINAFRFDGSRWNVAGLLHDVYWEA